MQPAVAAPLPLLIVHVVVFVVLVVFLLVLVIFIAVIVTAAFAVAEVVAIAVLVGFSRLGSRDDSMLCVTQILHQLSTPRLMHNRGSPSLPVQSMATILHQ